MLAHAIPGTRIQDKPSNVPYIAQSILKIDQHFDVTNLEQDDRQIVQQE